MEVNGKAKVFHNEKDGREWITISDSSKDVNGNRVYQNYNARFKNGQPRHESFIEFEGFTSYYKSDNGKVYTTIQIMNWQELESKQPQQQELLRTEWRPEKVDKDTPLPPTEDLPF